MVKRVLSSVIMVALFVPPVFLPDPRWITALGIVILFLATKEYISLTKMSQVFLFLNPLLFVLFVWVPEPFEVIIPSVAGLFILFSLIWVVRDASLHQSYHYLNLFIFLTIGGASIVSLRNTSLPLLVYALLIIIFTDVFAYFLGIKYGKHKLAPTISPKKSVEGLIAGTLLGSASGMLFGFISGLISLDLIQILLFTGISILISLIGQLGDLYASKIKRSYGVKDFGDLFPGHGGLLDRFDSMLMAGLFSSIVVGFLL
jgi:phosphatidate cytidylyltransferase